jgi:hypothetical protein
VQSSIGNNGVINFTATQACSLGDDYFKGELNREYIKMIKGHSANTALKTIAKKPRCWELSV